MVSAPHWVTYVSLVVGIVAILLAGGSLIVAVLAYRQNRRATSYRVSIQAEMEERRGLGALVPRHEPFLRGTTSGKTKRETTRTPLHPVDLTVTVHNAGGAAVTIKRLYIELPPYSGRSNPILDEAGRTAGPSPPAHRLEGRDSVIWKFDLETAIGPLNHIVGYDRSPRRFMWVARIPAIGSVITHLRVRLKDRRVLARLKDMYVAADLGDGTVIRTPRLRRWEQARVRHYLQLPPLD